LQNPAIVNLPDSNPSIPENTGKEIMERALTTTMDMAASRGRTEGIAAEEFDHLVRAYQRRVFRLLFSLVRDRDLADNLTQDCFLRAYQKRATFRGEASVETWLLRIAVNLARDDARNRRLAFWRNILQRTSSPEEEAAEIDFPDPGASPERALLAREQLAAAESALERISPQQRLAFSLRFFEEMTLEEIAAAMQLEVGTVKAHLFRAVSAVRNKLKEQK
jgi:RNA polymerase sigma-70 factor (ECF subfamily)